MWKHDARISISTTDMISTNFGFKERREIFGVDIESLTLAEFILETGNSS